MQDLLSIGIKKINCTVVCWQAWRNFIEKIAVVMNKGCHDVDLKNITLDFTTAGIVGISHSCAVLDIALC
jgi:hypothetical protein